MPMKGATKKQNRQYKHIKAAAKKKGRSTARAKEIAARTVNKQKRKAGGAKRKRG